jgi:predicted 2-oxoglutarate/Fe(II)-dependent dioxygenase YbiX
MDRKYKNIINNFLTEEECNNLIQFGDDSGFELSKIRTGQGDIIREDIRNNDRVIVKDGGVIADELFEKVRDELPEVIGQWQLKGLNEQVKIYKYTKGQQFKMHRDAPYVRHDNEQSFLTMMVYLNEGFEGGDTFFLDQQVKSETGKCLIFWQDQLHAGMEVTEGVKYAIRTDVMYEKI